MYHNTKFFKMQAETICLAIKSHYGAMKVFNKNAAGPIRGASYIFLISVKRVLTGELVFVTVLCPWCICTVRDRFGGSVLSGLDGLFRSVLCLTEMTSLFNTVECANERANSCPKLMSIT